jgi:hypothetical protein
MGLLDEEDFAEAYRQFILEGSPALIKMLAIIAPQAVNLDPLSRIVMFNMIGQYLNLVGLHLEAGDSIQEAHTQAAAAVMADEAVNQVVQAQLKGLIDQRVQRFQRELA